MNLPWFERISVRLGVAVAGVLLVLAVVINVLTNIAFERTSVSVQQTSAAELERSARESLRQITEREAMVIGSALEQYAVATRSAALYLRHALQEGQPLPEPERETEAEDPLEAQPVMLAQLESGHWTDPDPDRQTSLHVPSLNASRASVIRDVGQSEPLEELFPVLFPHLRDAVGIYFVSPDGFVRYYPPADFTGLLTPDFDVTPQPVFQLGTPQANPQATTRWTPPYTDDVGNGLTVTVLTPVYAFGQFRGTIDIDVSLVRLSDRLTAIEPLPESFALMIDSAGRLITSSPGATTMLGYPGELSFGELLDGSVLADLLTQMSSGGSGTALLSELERPLVVSHADLPDVGWTLLVGAPIAAVATPAAEIAQGIAEQARRAQGTIAVVGVVVFVIALGVLLLATRRWVLAPISSLVAGARRIGDGELGTTLSVESHGEFGVLGEAFNRMSHSLAHQRSQILSHQRELERQVAERTRELGNLFAISADLSAAPDGPSLLTAVLERLCGAVEFTSGSVWLFEGETTRRIAVASRQDEPPQHPAAVPTADLRSLLARAGEDEQLSLSRSAGPLPVVFPAGVEKALLVPLRYRDRLLGVLALADPKLSEAHQAALITTVAQQLGTALENARLLLDARERSALEERQHLARELHDSVSQALFGIVLGLQMAKKEAAGPGRLRDSIDYASELADAALKEMRALIFELRPEALEAEGLVGLLGRQAEALRARHEIAVELAAAEPPLHLNAKAVLYRVAQEALHNVVKHARAKSVRVTLVVSDGSVRLEVVDDGRGLEAGTQGTESYGLHSMRERMALLGGRLSVSSEPGAGTRVLAELPLVAQPLVDGAAHGAEGVAN